MGEHRGDAAAVLALEPLVGLEPLLHLLEPARLRLERVREAAKLAAHVLGLDAQGGEPCGELVESRIHALDRRREPLRLRQQLAHSTLSGGRGDRLRPAARGCKQTVHLPQAPALCDQLLLLLLARGERLDLLDLEGQQVEVAVARAGALAQLCEPVLELARPRVYPAEVVAGGELLATAEAVQEVELGGREHEPAMLVLTEEGEQPAAERLEVARRGRAPLDECPRAPARAHPPGQHDLVDGLLLGSDPVAQVHQLGLVHQPARKLEHPFHVRLARSRTHDPRARLAAQEQIQRVRKHGLARARLARDRGQAGSGPQLGALDQEQVLDAQLEEHHAGVPAPPDGAALAVTL